MKQILTIFVVATIMLAAPSFDRPSGGGVSMTFASAAEAAPRLRKDFRSAAHGKPLRPVFKRAAGRAFPRGGVSGRFSGASNGTTIKLTKPFKFKKKKDDGDPPSTNNHNFDPPGPKF